MCKRDRGVRKTKGRDRQRSKRERGSSERVRRVRQTEEREGQRGDKERGE